MYIIKTEHLIIIMLMSRCGILIYYSFVVISVCYIFGIAVWRQVLICAVLVDITSLVVVFVHMGLWNSFLKVSFTESLYDSLTCLHRRVRSFCFPFLREQNIDPLTLFDLYTNVISCMYWRCVCYRIFLVVWVAVKIRSHLAKEKLLFSQHSYIHTTALLVV